MESVRIIFLIGTMLFSCFGNSQSKPEDHLQVLEALDLDDMRSTMLSVSEHGLNPKAYWTDQMEWAYRQGGRENRELKNRTNSSFLRLLKDVSLGVVNPEMVGSDIKLKKKSFLSPSQLKVLLLASGSHAGPLLQSLTPQSAPYLALKESLRKVSDYCNRGEWLKIPAPKKDLKFGVRNSAIFAIKSRLRQLGYTILTIDDLFDAQTFAAIHDVQWMLRRQPDGVISPGGKTLKYLNVSCQDRMRQLRLDMEKLRWFPQNFENRYIFINLAMSYFTLVDKTGENLYAMSFRTINGRMARKSPTLQDKIVHIIINPFWVVPPTIFREDKVEEIKNMQPWEINDYFESHNYEVWNRSFTQRLDPTSIDWWRLGNEEDEKIYIRQKPNYMNALGVLKFMMTNSYAIYLHDTNQRELFADPQRLLSSGCVRVERPLDLAEYLLKGTPWTREVIQRYMAKPGEVLENETRVAVREAIPVYMVYLTSQLSSDGVLRFVEDSYNQGPRLLRLGAW